MSRILNVFVTPGIGQTEVTICPSTTLAEVIAQCSVPNSATVYVDGTEILHYEWEDYFVYTKTSEVWIVGRASGSGPTPTYQDEYGNWWHHQPTPKEVFNRMINVRRRQKNQSTMTELRNKYWAPYEDE